MRYTKSPETRKLIEFICHNKICYDKVTKIIEKAANLPDSASQNAIKYRYVPASYDIWHYFLFLEGNQYLCLYYRVEGLTYEDIVNALPMGKVMDWDVQWYQLAAYFIQRYDKFKKI